MRLLLLLVFVHQIFARSQPVPLTSEQFSRCLNKFSLDLLKKLDYENKNVVYSSLGIGMAVGMLLEGAQKEDRDKLFELIHCSNYGDRDVIHQHFKSLINGYKDMETRDTDPRNVTVELANLAMIKEGLNIPASFTDALKNDYEANVARENFAENGQQIIEKINKFVKERTHGLIPKLFDQPLNPATALVLLNTIYFKGWWEQIFPKYNTNNVTFHNADKSDKMIEMMHNYDTYLQHHHSDKHKASVVEVPYVGDFSMYLVVPDERYGLPDVVKSFKDDDIFDILPKMESTNVNLHMPKFNFEHKMELKKIIKELGVDVTNVLKPVQSSLEISDAIHKAKIVTHEDGTEASGVTVFIAVATSLQVKPPPKNINCDHPFLFIILDKKTKMSLFTGVVNEFK